jgi:hypothetical protein
MKFLVYKQVQTDRAEDLGHYMDMGFSVQRVQSVQATVHNGAAKSSPDKPTRKRRRRRKYLKVTPELVKQMADLRKEGLLYRIIGRRFGVTGARVGQILAKAGGK